jgi:hypothetical protein
VITERRIQHAVSFAWASITFERAQQTLTREDVEAYVRGWYAARVVGEFMTAAATKETER